MVKIKTPLTGVMKDYSRIIGGDSGKRMLGSRDRQILYDTAGKSCENCRKKILDSTSMQAGHKNRAASRGGRATLANSVCLCYDCNRKQGTDSWETFRKKQNKPIVPTAMSHLERTRSSDGKKSGTAKPRNRNSLTYSITGRRIRLGF